MTVRLDGVEVGQVTTNQAGLWVFTPGTALEERLYRVDVLSTDAAGNTSDPSEARAFTIDLGPPNPPVVSTPSDFVDAPRPTISGTAEPGSIVSISLDGEEPGTSEADTAGGWSVTPVTGLTAGTHVVVATARDQAGNVSTPSTEYTITIRRSHYGWSCASTSEWPLPWSLLLLAFLFLRHQRHGGATWQG